MKKEVLEIVKRKYQHLNGSLDLLSFLEQFIDAIEKQKKATKNKFNALLSKYNFHTIPSFCEYPEYPSVTLFKGVDSWTLCPVLDYEGGIGEMDEDIGILFSEPELYPSFENEKIGDLTRTLKTKIILTWLSSIWFEIDGASSGIIVKILENNSGRRFIFNDLAWDDLSIYNHYNDKTKAIGRYFKFTPKILDIYQRVSIETYPVYPYHNKWRFFKKDNVIKEFVAYGNETGQKQSNQGIEKLNIQEHETLLDRLKYEMDQTFKFIEDGFDEFIPEKVCKTPIYKGAIETKFHSGQHWYNNEQKNKLKETDINKIEKEYGITLPFYFKHYLRLFNGRKYNNINLNFPIQNGDYLKIKEFFNLEELECYLKEQSGNIFFRSLFKKKVLKDKWLPIGITENEKNLMIELESSLVGLKEADGKIISFDISFEEFIKEPRNY